MATKFEIQIPQGFTSASTEPLDGGDRWYEVLYQPWNDATRFESGTACFDATSGPRYRWKTIEGDNVRESGRTVFAWRRQPDSMTIVRTEVADELPTGIPAGPWAGLSYDRMIEVLAAEHLELAKQGMRDRPKSVDLTALIFDVSIEQVETDYKRVSGTLQPERAH